MTTILITGANKGLGRETARQLIAAGHTVYVGSRDESRGRETARVLGARFVQLDVTDDSSVAQAVTTIAAQGGIDVLVNNAGVEGRTADNGVIGAADVTAENMRAVFETNLFGVLRVTRAFQPLLELSAAPVIVNVSSGLGSLSGLSDPSEPTYFYPGVSYPASKAALNAVTIQLAKAWPVFRINSVDPGYTDTDLNGGTGTQTVEEGAAIIVRMAQTTPTGATGTFVSSDGSVSW